MYRHRYCSSYFVFTASFAAVVLLLSLPTATATVSAGKITRPVLPPGDKEAILVHHNESKFESSIAVVDRPNGLSLEFGGGFKEMKLFDKGGVRLLMFGSRSIQSGVALNKLSSAESPSNQKQLLNHSMPPVFRYVSAMALSIPLYELRAAKGGGSSVKCALCSDPLNERFPDETPLFEDKTSIRSILLVGLGSGSVIKTFRRALPSLSRVDAVEIDPVVVGIAKKFFDFVPGQDANVTVGDAAEILRRDVEENELEAERKFLASGYDLVVVDCAASFDGNIKSEMFPLYAGATDWVLPDTVQPSSCASAEFISLLFQNYISHKETSVIAFNFFGVLEGKERSGSFRRFLTRLYDEVVSSGRGGRSKDGGKIYIQPTLLRKWGNKFDPQRRGHRGANHFDNLVVLVTAGGAAPTAEEVAAYVLEDEMNADRCRGLAASTELFSDLARNRYDAVDWNELLEERKTKKNNAADDDASSLTSSASEEEREHYLKRHREYLLKSYNIPPEADVEIPVE